MRAAAALARAYVTLPDVSEHPATLVAARALACHVEAYRPFCDVVYVGTDPYPGGYAELRERVCSEGRILTYTGASSGLVWDPATNWRLRTWHDLCHHLGPDGGCDFTLQGEREAWRRASAELPGLAWLLFSEIVCQAAFFNIYGHFPDQQRIVRVPDRVLESWR